MAKIDKIAVAKRYDQTFRKATLNGLYRAREQFDEQWRPFVKPPPGGMADNNQDNWIVADMNAMDHRPFGRGNPLRFVAPEFWEQSITAKRQGIGFKIDWDDLSEDQIGKYTDVPFWLGYGHVQYQWTFFWDLMVGPAFDGSLPNFLSADGVTLISDSHPYKDRFGVSQTYSNMLTNKWSVEGWRQALDLRAKYRTLAGNKTGLSGSVEKTLVLSTKYARSAQEYFAKEFLASGESNTTEKPDRIMQCEALDDTNEEAWFIIYRFRGMDGMIAPIIFKEVETARLEMSPLTSDNVFFNKEVTWKLEHKEGFAAGDPVAIFGSNGTTAAL